MRTSNAYPLFVLPGASWCLTFTPEVVETLGSFSQTRWFQKESVGQLYSRNLTAGTIVIDVATRLKPKRATRSSVSIDPDVAMSEREAFLRDGLYCVGLWHSHPEPSPTPSSPDHQLAKDHALAAKDVLTGILFVIVGNRPFPDGWFVGMHDGQRLHEAKREVG